MKPPNPAPSQTKGIPQMIAQRKKYSRGIFRSMLKMRDRGLTPTRTYRPDMWTVPSQTITHRTYTVTITDVDAILETACTCKAGQAKRACKHSLLVLREFDRDTRHWLRLLEFQEGRAAA